MEFTNLDEVQERLQCLKLEISKLEGVEKKLKAQNESDAAFVHNVAVGLGVGLVQLEDVLELHILSMCAWADPETEEDFSPTLLFMSSVSVAMCEMVEDWCRNWCRGLNKVRFKTARRTVWEASGLQMKRPLVQDHMSPDDYKNSGISTGVQQYAAAWVEAQQRIVDQNKGGVWCLARFVYTMTQHELGPNTAEEAMLELCLNAETLGCVPEIAWLFRGVLVGGDKVLKPIVAFALIRFAANNPKKITLLPREDMDACFDYIEGIIRHTDGSLLLQMDYKYTTRDVLAFLHAGMTTPKFDPVYHSRIQQILSLLSTFSDGHWMCTGMVAPNDDFDECGHPTCEKWWSLVTRYIQGPLRVVPRSLQFVQFPRLAKKDTMEVLLNAMHRRFCIHSGKSGKKLNRYLTRCFAAVCQDEDCLAWCCEIMKRFPSKHTMLSMCTCIVATIFTNVMLLLLVLFHSNRCSDLIEQFMKQTLSAVQDDQPTRNSTGKAITVSFNRLKDYHIQRFELLETVANIILQPLCSKLEKLYETLPGILKGIRDAIHSLLSTNKMEEAGTMLQNYHTVIDKMLATCSNQINKNTTRRKRPRLLTE